MALLAADLDATRRLVHTSLGALAADTDSAARLRDTLLAFLAEKGSYAAAAARLHMHKNTVRYRVEAALAGRGRPINEDRLDLELALIACRRLGNAVLTPPGADATRRQHGVTATGARLSLASLRTGSR